MEWEWKGYGRWYGNVRGKGDGVGMEGEREMEIGEGDEEGEWRGNVRGKGDGKGGDMDQIFIKTQSPKCRLFLKIDQQR